MPAEPGRQAAAVVTMLLVIAVICVSALGMARLIVLGIGAIGSLLPVNEPWCREGHIETTHNRERWCVQGYKPGHPEMTDR